jgi:hypothetical protein
MKADTARAEVAVIVPTRDRPHLLRHSLGSILAQKGVSHEVVVVARACQVPAHPRLRFVRVRGPRRPFSLWYPWFFLFASLKVARAGKGLVYTMGAVVLNGVVVGRGL